MKFVIIALMLIKCAESAPFPDNMLHTRDPRQMPRILEQRGYEVRSITNPRVIRKSLAELDPWGCDDDALKNIHELDDFGKVAVRGRTFTETYHRGGRYYPTAEAYDKACWCPITYSAQWHTHGGRHRIEINELRNKKHVAVETTEIRVRDRDYYIFFDESVTKWVYETTWDKVNVTFLNLTERGPNNPIILNRQGPYRGVFGKAVAQITMTYLALTTRIRGQKQTQRIREPVARRVLGSSLSQIFTPEGALLVRKIDAMTALKMIDYAVNSMYEKYQWV